jgi:hypothetical protein
VDVDGNKVVAKGKDASDKSLISGMFGSFADAPDGFGEEMKEFMVSTALEYWYLNAFAARVGYFHESEDKGNRKFITLGAGVRYKQFGADFAYLIPVRQNNPLADTIRISLLMNFNKATQTTPSPAAE